MNSALIVLRAVAHRAICSFHAAAQNNDSEYANNYKPESVGSDGKPASLAPRGTKCVSTFFLDRAPRHLLQPDSLRCGVALPKGDLISGFTRKQKQIFNYDQALNTFGVNTIDDAVSHSSAQSPRLSLTAPTVHSNSSAARCVSRKEPK